MSDGSQPLAILSNVPKWGSPAGEYRKVSHWVWLYAGHINQKEISTGTGHRAEMQNLWNFDKILILESSKITFEGCVVK